MNVNYLLKSSKSGLRFSVDKRKWLALQYYCLPESDRARLRVELDSMKLDEHMHAELTSLDLHRYDPEVIADVLDELRREFQRERNHNVHAFVWSNVLEQLAQRPRRPVALMDSISSEIK